jgi:hypothetical protein
MDAPEIDFTALRIIFQSLQREKAGKTQYFGFRISSTSKRNAAKGAAARGKLTYKKTIETECQLRGGRRVRRS